jgi:phosphoglycerate kinase
LVEGVKSFLTMDDIDFGGKTTLVRVDFNSPLDPNTKMIQDDSRIRAHAPTIKELSEKGARVVVLAHQGRPGDPDFSTLEEHAKILSKILGKTPVRYVNDILGEKAQSAIRQLKNGEILVLENVRVFPGETDKKTVEEHAKSELVTRLAPLAQVFVNDAFAAAHRAHASTVGFTPVLPTVAGRLMEKELDALERATKTRAKPCVYVLGGAKADDAEKISEYVLGQGIADQVITGGVIANLFLEAAGRDLGVKNRDYLRAKDLEQYVPQIKEILKKYGGRVVLPDDLAVEVGGKRREIDVSKLPTDRLIFDIGSKSIAKYSDIIGKAKTIVLNGPMGVYEKDEFLAGTKRVFEAIAKSKAFSIAGGGHTVAALEKLGLIQGISYVSSGGGALMEYLSGKKLPAVEALQKARRP